jgi:hypothetical protein
LNHGYATLTHTPHPTHLTSQGRSEREREREREKKREREKERENESEREMKCYQRTLILNRAK